MIDDKDSKCFRCSFCKRKKNEVQKLIAGKNSQGVITFICDMCTEVCYLALKNNSKKHILKEKKTLLKPSEIYNELCKFVQSQDEVKKCLSVAAYNHYKRIFSNEQNLNIEKSNILLVGKSGSGKTLLVDTLSKILDVPFITVDVTSMTEAGYVGEDVESCISRLLQEAKFDVQKAQQGIVFLDEVDKLRKKNNSVDGAIDVSGVGVQQSLLKLMEGTVVNVPATPGKRGYNQETIAVDTKNILFICAGAFEDLSKIVEKDVKNGIGFNDQNQKPSNYDILMKHLNNEHLIKYGMIPEFIGRVPIHLVMQELTANDLISILITPQNAILKQYQNLLCLNDGASLSWTKEALNIIAERAIKNKTGARGLKSIVEKILLKTMFDIPSLKENVEIIIDKNAALGEKSPLIKKIKKKVKI